jgi:hypothetical protein
MAEIFDFVQFGFLVRAFTVLFALGISYISFEGWRRRKRPLLLLVSLAFLAYLLRDVIRLSEMVLPGSTSPIFVSIADILDLVTLLLIFFAVARK